MNVYDELTNCVIKGRFKSAGELAARVSAEGGSAKSALEALLAGMADVGEKFKKGVMFVPEVMAAAKAFATAADILRPELVAVGVEPLGKAVIGTVKGDRHDIGKNLVRMMLEGAGFDVTDLGVDVPAERFVEACKAEGAKLVCCSALLTTTMTEMGRVVKAFEDAGLRRDVVIMVGGAPVTAAFCERIGADAYAPDCSSAAETAKRLVLGKL